MGRMFEVGMRYRWRLPESSDATAQEAATLARQLGVPSLVADLLCRRGLTDPAVANQFIEPKLTDLHDPADLPGADQAARRIDRAARDGQPIIIYGDYDADGITAGAILWHVLSAAGANVRCYVPHRIDEGYGLHSRSLELLARSSSNAPLIVSVDCGITAVEPARAARAMGLELIVTDHHELPPGELPEASLLVHPRLKGSTYPFGYLCGAGVAFKLAWQFAKVHCGSDRVPDVFRDLLLDLLSLAALGTVADVVPLVDENRVITAYGIGQIKRTRFAGLNALIDAAHLREHKIEAYHLGFALGPRINACGRMGHADQAVRLLTDATESESAEIATFLNSENERRRAIEGEIFDDARQMVLDLGHDRDDCRAIVLERAGWHPGVLGIVASRLVDKFARPVVLLNVDNGEAHGSARSVEGVAIHEAIASCGDLLNSFGGHAMAAGLRLDARKVGAFRSRFTDHVNALLGLDDLVHTIQIDGASSLEELDVALLEQIERLAPFGRGNPSPVLCLRRARLESSPQRVGREGRHLRLILKQGRRTIGGIGFGFGDLADRLAAGMHLDVVFQPKLSTWGGQVRAECHVKDVKLA